MLTLTYHSIILMLISTNRYLAFRTASRRYVTVNTYLLLLLPSNYRGIVTEIFTFSTLSCFWITETESCRHKILYVVLSTFSSLVIGVWSYFLLASYPSEILEGHRLSLLLFYERKTTCCLLRDKVQTRSEFSVFTLWHYLSDVS